MYHPTLGRWVQRDPLGYVDGMSVYAYTSGGPLAEIDPFGLTEKVGDVGLYKLTRDSTKSRAILCAKKRFRSSILAGPLGLSSSDVDKWLIDEKTGKPAGAMLEAGQCYTVPNLIILQKGDMSLKEQALLGPVMWKSLERVAQELQSKKGYMIKKENVTKAAEAKKALGNADLMAYGYAGHGIGDGGLWVSGPSEKEMKEGWNPDTGTPIETLSPGLYVHHKIEYLWLMACYSIEPDEPASRWMPARKFDPPKPFPNDVRRVSEWSRNVSEFGYLIGFTDEVHAYDAKKKVKQVQGSLVPAPKPKPSPTTQPQATTQPVTTQPAE
jgi:hypothetical protein